MALTTLLPALWAGTAPESVGEWSAEEHYLKARFVARHEFANGESEFVVYLELCNTCPRAGTIMLKLNFDPAANITGRVTRPSH